MKEMLDIIQKVESRFLKMKAKVDDLEKEVSSKNKEINRLKDLNSNNEASLQALKEKWENHQCAVVEVKNDENNYSLSSEEMEAMVNEIDKCIALLKDKQ